MPHQCTNCGHAFPDGSKEMLSGCPDCGGNKFQFKPAGKIDSQSTTDQSASSTPTTDSPSSSPPATDSPSSSPPTTNSPSSTQSPPETEGVGGDTDQSLDSSTEAPAQSTARSDVASSEEVTAAGSMGPQSDSQESAPDSQPARTEPPAESSSEAEDIPEGSSLDQLRKELNNQFESIRIVSPGQYELNLMELYDRDEYIISLREDGRYVIEVPDGWGDS